jgi:GPH family glycoside/pentoside/hexuronide:cation symporter
MRGTPTPPPRSLTRTTKAVFGVGDLTLNLAGASLTLVFLPFFLLEVAGLRPALAGLVPLVGRFVDAVTDPLMGRISDRTPWAAGRRKPYLLIGALPFAASFAMLWMVPPVSSQAALFAYYLVLYCLFSLAITVLSVPYLALMPEMAREYDERTSLNLYRTAASAVGILLAVGVRPLADAAGGGTHGFAVAGLVAAGLIAVPWIAVHRVCFERPGQAVVEAAGGFWQDMRSLFRRTSFVQLVAIYLCSRIAMDVLAALMILYLSYWIGSSDLFEPVMAIFLLTAIAALPFWLRFSLGRDKAKVFIAGALAWGVASAFMYAAQPGWPTAAILALGCFSAVGFAAIDLIPISMLGEVIDEDDLATGLRREGIYNGTFTFLRKAGAGIGVFMTFGILDWVGFEKGAPQSEVTRQAIRALTSGAPLFFLALAAWTARSFPLTREVHLEIVEELSLRDSGDSTSKRGR